MIEAKAIIEAVQKAENIVITAHRSPDGDSVGSSLGLLRFLQTFNKNVVICHPDPCPNFLEWAKHEDQIIDFETNEDEVRSLFSKADILFALDYNGAGRLGSEMGELFSASTAFKIMIDHHMNPDDFVDIAVSQPEIGSTSQLIFELIESSGNADKITARMMEPLYLGIMTDTGSFRFDSVNSRTHEVISKMLATGLNHTAIHENTFDGNRIDKLKLRGYAIAEKLEVLTDYKTAIISLTNDELKRFNYIKGDTEGLVNVALSVEGVEVAAFFTEKDGKVKISFRSKGTPINMLASDHFGGGGHKYAAGGISEDTLENTIAKFKKLIPEYIHA